MSSVGPRPDIPGYYDQLIGDDRKVLKLRPELTSLGAIKYCNEDELLKN
jgi:lipopolysaccharide/colanic/teichoic acid biosynthesis glycosyltransferase